MPAIFHNTTIEQGSSYSITFLYTDENNATIDVSSYCALLQWKTNSGDTYAFSNRYDGTDYSLVTDTNGAIKLIIPAKTTNNYLFDSAVYDLVLQEPNEEYPGSGLKTYRLATGTVIIAKKNTDGLLVNCADISSSFNLANNCNVECGKLDVYSFQYDGSGALIPDNGSVTSTISTTDTRLIENIEVAINGLRHNSPQDLTFILSPPTGSKILLSASSKIVNYRPGFSFMFSNRAAPGITINNVTSGGLCSIQDKTSTVKYNNEILLSNFNSLFNTSSIGNWSLIIVDNDIGISGLIESWKLIVTYKPEPDQE
jgi:subtilisin-like proprotein convertase family protein